MSYCRVYVILQQYSYRHVTRHQSVDFTQSSIAAAERAEREARPGLDVGLRRLVSSHLLSSGVGQQRSAGRRRSECGGRPSIGSSSRFPRQRPASLPTPALQLTWRATRPGRRPKTCRQACCAGTSYLQHPAECVEMLRLQCVIPSCCPIHSMQHPLPCSDSINS